MRWDGTSALPRSFSREQPRVELTLLEGYAGTLWRDKAPSPALRASTQRADKVVVRPAARRAALAG